MHGEGSYTKTWNACVLFFIYKRTTGISIRVFDYQYNKSFTVIFFHDFLKKLVKEACLVDLLFISVCAFLFAFFAGDGLFSFTGGSLVI